MDIFPLDRLDKLLGKYLQNLTSPEEEKEMIALLLRADQEGIMTPKVKEVWRQLRHDQREYPVDWQKMYDTVTDTRFNVPVERYLQKKRFSLSRFALASLIAGVIFTAAYLYLSMDTPPNPVVAGRSEAPVKATRAASGYSSIHLPDGSTVILFPGSALDYSPSFNKVSREVTLIGQGYFDIISDSKRPFVVHTGKISTKVLGTAFDIKAYPGDESIEVTVKRGKVQVLNDKKAIGLVTANQRITFSRTTEKYDHQILQPEIFTASKPEEIFFDNISLDEAARQLETRFHLPVEFVSDEIKECRITATFLPEDDLHEMLTVICGVIKAKYVIANHRVIIDGNRCNN